MTLIAVAHILRIIDGQVISYERTTHPDLLDDIVLAEDVVPGKLVGMRVELVES